MGKKPNGKNELLPFSVIAEAADGDIDAINRVLKHYEKHIISLATRRLYDENGIPHLYVDEEMRKMLEIKLITRILKFDVNKAV